MCTNNSNARNALIMIRKKFHLVSHAVVLRWISMQMWVIAAQSRLPFCHHQKSCEMRDSLITPFLCYRPHFTTLPLKPFNPSRSVFSLHYSVTGPTGAPGQQHSWVQLLHKAMAELRDLLVASVSPDLSEAKAVQVTVVLLGRFDSQNLRDNKWKLEALDSPDYRASEVTRGHLGITVLWVKRQNSVSDTADHPAVNSRSQGQRPRMLDGYKCRADNVALNVFSRSSKVIQVLNLTQVMGNV